MKVGLFIPCYVDQLYPQVGIATLQLLEKLQVQVVYPQTQTCCGQPLGNSGYEEDSKKIGELFVDNFKEVDCIVAPSGSCVYHVKKHFDILEQTEAVAKVRHNIYELSQFITQVLGITHIEAYFPCKVGIHKSCHGLRGLRLGPSSECMQPRTSLEESLLLGVEGLELKTLKRPDECCGFGGTFSVFEEAVSIKMGKDRIQDHLDSDVEVITGTDQSCLMHLQGLINRNKKPIKVMHLAEILNSTK